MDEQGAPPPPRRRHRWRPRRHRRLRRPGVYVARKLYRRFRARRLPPRCAAWLASACQAGAPRRHLRSAWPTGPHGPKPDAGHQPGRLPSSSCRCAGSGYFAFLAGNAGSNPAVGSGRCRSAAQDALRLRRRPWSLHTTHAPPAQPNQCALAAW